MPAKRSTIDEDRKAKAEADIKAKQREVKYDLRDFTIEYIVLKFKQDFFYVPEYQRKFIWRDPQKCRFIESVLLGLPIPMMFVADMDDGRLEIVDGAQRIQTLEAFLADDLKLDGLERLPTLNGFKHSDLPTPQQNKFGTKPLRMVVLEDSTTPETRQEIFDRVNTSGEEARPSEIRRGAHPGPFMEFVKECSSDPLFLELCPISEKVRMRREDEELVVRFFAYSDRYQEFEHFVEDFLDEYVKDYKDNFDKNSLEAQFNRMLEFVKRHFPYGFAKSKKARSTPRVRFEAISVGVNLALREKPDLIPGPPAKWLKSEEFICHTTTHASNSGPRLCGRVEYVRDRLLEGAR